MGVAAVFLLGIANFALHRAVLESGHRLVGVMTAGKFGWSSRLTLTLEFVALLAALWLVAGGHGGWALAYACYSAANGFSAWLILTGRI